MRTLTDSDRNTLPRGWVRQAVMGVLRWKDVSTAGGGGRSETLHKGVSLQVRAFDQFIGAKQDAVSMGKP